MTKHGSLPRRAFGIGLLLAGLALVTPVEAASWPQRTVRIITSGAGASSDAVARALADGLSKRWNKPVVVENRAGADHILAIQELVNSSDGHTLLFVTHSAFTVNPLLHAKLPYDPVHDVAPISLAVEDFLCVVAAPALLVNSLKDLVAVARTKPAELNYFAVPGSPHLAFLAFQKRADIAMTFVSYRTVVPAIADLSEGRIQLAVMPLAAALGQVKAGKLRLLAVTNSVRSPAAPEAPTAAEVGFPDFTFGGLLGLFAPKSMASEMRERIASEVKTILGQPEVNERLTNLGLVTRGTSAAEFAAILDEQRAKWAAIARAHGIKPASSTTP
jgi:tripartite-type tricarboxylate transporter receptor subunit TctC